MADHADHADHPADAGHPAPPAPGSHAAHMATTPENDKAATKGLIIGALVFVALWVVELLDGGTEADGLISVSEILIYGIVGMVVGVVVKAIAKTRG